MFSLNDHIIPPNWLIYIYIEDIYYDMCLLGVHLNYKPRCITTHIEVPDLDERPH